MVRNRAVAVGDRHRRPQEDPGGLPYLTNSDLEDIPHDLIHLIGRVVLMEPERVNSPFRRVADLCTLPGEPYLNFTVRSFDESDELQPYLALPLGPLPPLHILKVVITRKDVDNITLE